MADTDIGSKIKALRKEHHLTLEQVGEAVGVGKSTVRKWETGIIANMRRDKIANLADVLSTTPAYLMGWDEEEKPATEESGFDVNRFREAMGDISIVELADRLGCGKSSVSMYLSGQRVPSKMAIQLISLNLGVNPAWLSGLDAPKESNAKIISKNNAPIENDERTARFVKLFTQLTPEHQDVVLAQLEGLVSRL